MKWVKGCAVVGMAVVLLLGLAVAFYTFSSRVRALVLYGADLQDVDLGGWTVLHRAAASGDLNMVQHLLGRGVHKNARTIRGETAWHLADSLGHADIAELLVASGVETSEVERPAIVGPYLGQALPGETPQLFFPGVVSGHYRAHSPCVFSPDLATVYWTSMRPGGGRVEMMRVEGPGYEWSWPETVDMTGEPSFAPDGKRLFFLSREATRPGEPGGRENLWVTEKSSDGWAEPRPLGDAVNSRAPHFHHSVDRYGNLYFSDYKTIYYSEYRGGKYGDAVDLAVLTGNDTLRGNSPYISPAGDLLLFAAAKGLWDRGKELFVSFRRSDGTWTHRISLGEEINADGLNDSPRLTPAGNFLFFVSSGKSRPWGIYWVSAEILDQLKEEHLGGGGPEAEVVAARGLAPRIDGVFGPGEWDDASVVELSATKKMWLKHDDGNLYVALDAPGGDLYFYRDDVVEVLHSSFALVRTEYVSGEDGNWHLEHQTDLQLHGLQNRPAGEIDAAVHQHLLHQGWVASLIPMGSPYELEYAISFEWLGIEASDSVVHETLLARMATRHIAGPPQMRPTWPHGINLSDSYNVDVAEHDVATWGRVLGTDAASR